MKLLKLLPAAAIAFLAVSCQNGGGSLSESSTPTDSLMYYLGQMHAADYLREANRDTVMKETGEKDAYLSGVRAGLAAMKEGNETYNKGVMMGMQMASQMMSFSEQMGVQINKNAYVGSLTAALMADTMPNTSMVQRNFREVMQNIEKAKEEKDKATSQASLSQVAQKDGYPKINDDLYGKVTNALPNDTTVLADGNEVTVKAEITKENGDKINIPVSPKGKVGNKRSFPEIVSSAIMTLKSGETGEFLTSAHALVGSRASQLDLKPEDVVKMTITATLVPPADDEKKK